MINYHDGKLDVRVPENYLYNRTIVKPGCFYGCNSRTDEIFIFNEIFYSYKDTNNSTLNYEDINFTTRLLEVNLQ